MDVPVIDLSQDSETKLVDEIARACSTIGFFQVINHGIPESLVAEFRHQCQAYFRLPAEVKKKWKRHEQNARGYFDDELTKQRRDWKEALDLGVPGGTRDWEHPETPCLDGSNQLPTEDELQGFTKTIKKYFKSCEKLSHRLAVLMAKGIVPEGSSTDLIQDLKDHHTSYLRLNYYPTCVHQDQDTPGDPVPLGISPHKDAGFLTILLQDDDCHSLQVVHPDSESNGTDHEWTTVHPRPGALTINTGDMAQVWSNGKLRAPLHRVLTSDRQERYSAPFFYNPGYATLVEPVKACGEDIRYHPVLWGYFRALRFAGDLTDLGVEIQIKDFEKETSDKTHWKRQALFREQVDFQIPFSVEKHRPLLDGTPLP